jgi:hypothetical protein
MIASAMSEVVPPHFPVTRTGTMDAARATPATPLALWVTAPMTLATFVPCQVDDMACMPSPHSASMRASPGSVGSASRPSPSAALSTSLTKS